MPIRARDRSLSDMVADRIRLFMGLEELGETEGEWLGEGAWGRVERREEGGDGRGGRGGAADGVMVSARDIAIFPVSSLVPAGLG